MTNTNTIEKTKESKLNKIMKICNTKQVDKYLERKKNKMISSIQSKLHPNITEGVHIEENSCKDKSGHGSINQNNSVSSLSNVDKWKDNKVIINY